MRIAIVHNTYPPSAVGGAEIAAHCQACGLISAGHEVAVFTGLTDAFKPPYQILHDVSDQVPVTRVVTPPSRHRATSNYENPLVDVAFDEFCQGFKPDVVHFHNLPSLSLRMLDVTEGRGVPAMVTLHDYWGYCLRNTLLRPEAVRTCPDWSECHLCQPMAFFSGQLIPVFLRTSYIRFQLHKARLFHFPSRQLMHDYATADFDLDRSVQHSLGITNAPWTEREPRGARLRVVFSGRLSRHKGPQVVLGALERLKDEGLDNRFELSIYGEGELRDELQSWIDDKGWRETVLLKGAVPNSVVRAAYAQADVGMNASIWPENEPVSVLEALKAGTPVIASAIGGNQEIIEDGVNGWLFEAGSTVALARLLQRLETSRAELSKMRHVARASVAPRTTAAALQFLLATYATLRDSPAAATPSVVALVCRDFSNLDGALLHRASRTAYWRDSEWLLWNALQRQEDFGAVVAVLWLNGPLPRDLQRLGRNIPIVTLGHPGEAPPDGFQNLITLDSLSDLPGLGDVIDKIGGRHDETKPPNSRLSLQSAL